MSALAQMKLLVSLAQIDGSVAEREKSYIRTIGVAYKIDSEDIEPLFDRRHELLVPENMTEDERFNFIFSLVQLMKIDERMYKEEILFCSTIATKLGYDKEVMFDLMLHVKSATMKDEEVNELRALVRSHLTK